MSWLGRLAGLGIGGLGLCAAAMAAVLTFLADAPLSDRVRGGLVSAAGEHSDALLAGLASPIAVGGFALLALIGLFFAFKPQSQGAAADDSGAADKSSSDASKLDPKLVKKTIKAANQAARKGLVLEAAEMLFACDEFDKAADYFEKAEDYTRAAEIRHDQNRFVESAELYVKAGDFSSAGVIFGQQEEHLRAAECYLEANAKSTAAEMFEKAGDFRRAGDCYRDVEFLRHAAQCYVKCKSWKPAADCLAEVYADESNKGGGGQDPNKHAEMSKMVRQCAKLYMRAEEPEKALDMLRRGRCWEEAAQVAMRLGHFGDAAEFYKEAGELTKSAEALQQLGEGEAAARVLAEYHRKRGELPEAAEQLEIADELNAAGDLYRQVENYPKAGECYAKYGEHLQAAEMYNMAGDRASAAEAFERGGRFREAAECFALVGQGEREAALLDKAGDHLLAGQAYHREGLDDEAITVLQQVGQGDDFPVAAALLADIFRGRGQFSLAIKKLRQAIADEQVERETIPMFYTLATLHEENGDSDGAVEIYEKILALDYHYEDVEGRLARLREQAPVKAEALLTQDSASAPAVSVNSQSGRYRVVGELGRGGMGVVYKAQDTVLDRLVAFKVLPDSFKENPQALKNFLREAKAAAKLNHPNIVTVYDTGEQDGRYYIAMEYVDGTTLKEIVRRRGAISPSGVLHVMVQVCEALAYAHEKKVVHRDIKSANAMWTRDKKAKIMDFGLAKVVEEVRNHTTVVSGTPYYMSPEQTLGKNVDHRTDIYSLGVTMFELATGRVPFKEGNIPYHHVHTAPPDVRSLCPGLPESLGAIINRCLEKDADARFQTAGEILEEVRATLSS